MVWINTQCQNYSPPRRYPGEIVFGGAKCICAKCLGIKEPEPIDWPEELTPEQKKLAEAFKEVEDG